MSLDYALSQISFNFKYGDKTATFFSEYFVSIPCNVIVIKIKTTNAPLKFTFVLNGTERVEVNNSEYISFMIGMLDSREVYKEGLKFFSKAKVINNNENESIILISATTEYAKIIKKEEHSKYDDIINEVKEYIEKASELSYDELKENHIKEYKKYYGRVSVDIDEKDKEGIIQPVE